MQQTARQNYLFQIAKRPFKRRFNIEMSWRHRNDFEGLEIVLAFERTAFWKIEKLKYPTLSWKISSISGI